MSKHDEATAQAVELLSGYHEFPGPFTFRVVVHPGRQGAVVAAMAALVGPDGAVTVVQERRSRTGRYVSIHVEVRVEHAEQVLEGYALLRTMEGVVTAL